MLAIFRDVTEREQQRQELETLRTETLHRTQEVIAQADARGARDRRSARRDDRGDEGRADAVV